MPRSLVARDRVYYAVNGSEPLASREPLLQEPVILFENVVEIGYSSAPAAITEVAKPFQFFDSGRIGRVTIDVDDSGTSISNLAQRKPEKAFGCNQVALGREKKINRVPS